MSTATILALGLGKFKSVACACTRRLDGTSPTSRLVAAGKKMQAIGVCMRKLAVLCYEVLKGRAPFDPQWASKRPLDITLAG